MRSAGAAAEATSDWQLEEDGDIQLDTLGEAVFLLKSLFYTITPLVFLTFARISVR